MRYFAVAIKKGLGKGLSALLPEGKAEPDSSPGAKLPDTAERSVPDKNPREDPAGNISPEEKPPNNTSPADREGGIFSVALDMIKANPGQPRKKFDDQELEELAESIRQQGVIQPIIAADAGDGTYTIIAGERRTRAARLAGLREIPVIIREYSGERRMEVSLIENVQRSNLNPIEEASAYRQLMEAENLSQDEVAVKVGKNRATVANALRLLKLPGEMQDSIQNGELTPGHARAVLSVPGIKEQELLFREVIKKGLSVRETEKRAAAIGNKTGQKKEAKPGSPEITAMQEKFIARLGTKVAINGDLKKGTIVIDYYSMDDLDRLYEILGG